MVPEYHSEGFVSVYFGNEPLASTTPAPRFCVFPAAQATETSVRIEVLVKKTQAHRVANAALGVGLTRCLIFDLSDGPYVMLEMLGDIGPVGELARRLKRMRFEQVVLPPSALDGRPRSLHAPLS